MTVLSNRLMAGGALGPAPGPASVIAVRPERVPASGEVLTGTVGFRPLPLSSRSGIRS